MKTITLKNIPEELLKKLKELAKDNNRSLNSEIIYILKIIYESGQLSKEEIMEKAHKIRASIHIRLPDSDIGRAKSDGRL